MELIPYALEIWQLNTSHDLAKNLRVVKPPYEPDGFYSSEFFLDKRFWLENILPEASQSWKDFYDYIDCNWRRYYYYKEEETWKTYIGTFNWINFVNITPDGFVVNENSPLKLTKWIWWYNTNDVVWSVWSTIVRTIYRWEYDKDTSYAINDIVIYWWEYYICKTASVNFVPTNTTYWKPSSDWLFASYTLYTLTFTSNLDNNPCVITIDWVDILVWEWYYWNEELARDTVLDNLKLIFPTYEIQREWLKYIFKNWSTPVAISINSSTNKIKQVEFWWIWNTHSKISVTVDWTEYTTTWNVNPTLTTWLDWVLPWDYKTKTLSNKVILANRVGTYSPTNTIWDDIVITKTEYDRYTYALWYKYDDYSWWDFNSNTTTIDWISVNTTLSWWPAFHWDYIISNLSWIKTIWNNFASNYSRTSWSYWIKIYNKTTPATLTTVSFYRWTTAVLKDVNWNTLTSVPITDGVATFNYTLSADTYYRIETSLTSSEFYAINYVSLSNPIFDISWWSLNWADYEEYNTITNITIDWNYYPANTYSTSFYINWAYKWYSYIYINKLDYWAINIEWETYYEDNYNNDIYWHIFDDYYVTNNHATVTISNINLNWITDSEEEAFSITNIPSYENGYLKMSYSWWVIWTWRWYIVFTSWVLKWLTVRYEANLESQLFILWTNLRWSIPNENDTFQCFWDVWDTIYLWWSEKVYQIFLDWALPGLIIDMLDVRECIDITSLNWSIFVLTKERVYYSNVTTYSNADFYFLNFFNIIWWYRLFNIWKAIILFSTQNKLISTVTINNKEIFWMYDLNYNWNLFSKYSCIFTDQTIMIFQDDLELLKVDINESAKNTFNINVSQVDTNVRWIFNNILWWEVYFSSSDRFIYLLHVSVDWDTASWYKTKVYVYDKQYSHWTINEYEFKIINFWNKYVDMTWYTRYWVLGIDHISYEWVWFTDFGTLEYEQELNFRLWDWERLMMPYVIRTLFWMPDVEMNVNLDITFEIWWKKEVMSKILSWYEHDLRLTNEAEIVEDMIWYEDLLLNNWVVYDWNVVWIQNGIYKTWRFVFFKYYWFNRFIIWKSFVLTDKTKVFINELTLVN